MNTSGPVMSADPTCGLKGGGGLDVVDGTNADQHTIDAPVKASPSTRPSSSLLKAELSDELSSVLSSQLDNVVHCEISGFDSLSSDGASGRDDPTSSRGMTQSEYRFPLQKNMDTTAQRDACVKELCEIIMDILRQPPKSVEFEKLKAHIYNKMKELEQSHCIELKRSDDMISCMRMEMLEDRVRLRVIEKGLHENYKADVKCKANELLDLRTKEVYNDNLALIREKALLTNDVKLTRDRENALDEENTALRRTVNVNASIESDLKTRCVQYKKEILKLKDQVKSVEDSIEKVSKDYEARLSQQGTLYTKQIKALIKERDDARCDALQLNAELIKLRKAAAQVLCQRGDLENFFYEALNEVRAQIIYERRQQLLTSHTKSINNRDGISQEVMNSIRHTNASALRIENQRLLQIRGSPMAYFSSSRLPQPAHECGEGFHACTSSTSAKGSTCAKALPPIPHPATPGSTSDLSSELCLLEQTMGGAGARPPREQQGPLSSQERSALIKGSVLRNSPGGLTWKTIQHVDISELSWTEKEQVLQILFERIRGQRLRLAQKAILRANAKPKDSAVKSRIIDYPRPPEEETPKSTLFLTQT